MSERLLPEVIDCLTTPIFTYFVKMKESIIKRAAQASVQPFLLHKFMKSSRYFTPKYSASSFIWSSRRVFTLGIEAVMLTARIT